jgi:hypothetical protein
MPADGYRVITRPRVTWAGYYPGGGRHQDSGQSADMYVVILPITIGPSCREYGGDTAEKGQKLGKRVLAVRI